MTKQQQRQTAKIYTFPTPPRMRLDGHHDSAKPNTQQAAPQFETVEYGGGWYHEAAVEEDSGNYSFRRH